MGTTEAKQCTFEGHIVPIGHYFGISDKYDKDEGWWQFCEMVIAKISMGEETSGYIT